MIDTYVSTPLLKKFSNFFTNICFFIGGVVQAACTSNTITFSEHDIFLSSPADLKIFFCESPTGKVRLARVGLGNNTPTDISTRE